MSQTQTAIRIANILSLRVLQRRRRIPADVIRAIPENIITEAVLQAKLPQFGWTDVPVFFTDTIFDNDQVLQPQPITVKFSDQPTAVLAPNPPQPAKSQPDQPLAVLPDPAPQDAGNGQTEAKEPAPGDA